MTSLADLLEYSARHYPERVAVEDLSGRTVTYVQLDELAGLLRDRLIAMGVQPGDRVGLYLRKSIDAVASIFGILKAGGGYVPTDPSAPASRNAYILNDCSVKVAIVHRRFEASFRSEYAGLGPLPTLLVLEDDALLSIRTQEREELVVHRCETVPRGSDDLAYILYTSGSTGKPKGVVLSQQNAMLFIDWCSAVFQPTAADCFSSHAPLHFDLSILDLFVSIKHGARLVLIGEEISKDPVRLAPLIAERRISIWYSAPSILSLLAQYGKLDQYDYSGLRMVLFAGEVFPVKHLRALKRLLPSPRFFNLYGPTETNVCTYYELPRAIPDDRTEPFPIGRACEHYVASVLDESGAEVAPGAEGELCISGAGVMQGYWNLPEQSARSFLVDAGRQRWYKTGDLVVQQPDGNYIYRGRRDRMVKKRGYRIELGEIESCIYGFPAMKEVGVVASSNDDGVHITCFFATENRKRASAVELKRFCAERLPLYMVPDVFSYMDVLPRTSTGKVDYQRLKAGA